eukprot:1161538-Pelagomonas_calceolata.AAC.2
MSARSAAGQGGHAPKWASVMPRQWKAGTFVCGCLGASVDLSHWKNVVDLYGPCMTLEETTVRVLGS